MSRIFFLELLKKNLNSSPQLSHCTHLNNDFSFSNFNFLNIFSCLQQCLYSVNSRVSRILRHLAASPSFGGQIAGAGGTPRLSYLPSKRWRSEMPLDGANTADS